MLYVTRSPNPQRMQSLAKGKQWESYWATSYDDTWALRLFVPRDFRKGGIIIFTRITDSNHQEVVRFQRGSEVGSEKNMCGTWWSTSVCTATHWSSCNDKFKRSTAMWKSYGNQGFRVFRYCPDHTTKPPIKTINGGLRVRGIHAGQLRKKMMGIRWGSRPRAIVHYSLYCLPPSSVLPLKIELPLLESWTNFSLKHVWGSQDNQLKGQTEVNMEIYPEPRTHLKERLTAPIHGCVNPSEFA